MPVICVVENDDEKRINYVVGESLLQILRRNNFHVSSPCGGNGTCGKCSVRIIGYGVVSSCLYYPDSDLKVILPGKREAKILTNQYKNTLYLPLKLNELATKVAYPLGLAIDIGTTSVVFYWLSLISGSILKTKAIENPQSKYGADVISRITYSNTTNGIENLQQEIVGAINHQIKEYTEKEDVAKENLVKISVSANTTMLHMLLGVDPLSIALAPFKPMFTEAKCMKAIDLNIHAHQDATIHLLPSISAYVGADIVSGIASLRPSLDVKNYLFIDIGTNGEMAVVTPNKIYCCATAAGPAFEGANIFCGMAALEGAISVYEGESYRTISGCKPIGICGSGLFDVIAYLIDHEIVLSDGELGDDFILVPAEESATGKNIVITPQDIREVQLAKSAIITGVNIIIKEAGLTVDDLDAVYVAGGFGNYMNPRSAVKVGLLPAEVLDKIVMVGNTSGAGAVLHVLSEDFDSYLNAIVEKSEIVELSKHSEFEMEFAMNMFF